MPKIFIRRYNPAWGSHIPLLIKIFEMSKGSVLELGTGIFSTPLLHMLCMDKNRMLVSYDNDKGYIDLHKEFVSDMHQIKFVEDWDKADIENKKWGMVLIDHAPEERRIFEVRRLVNSAEFIIIHDSNGRFNNRYHYRQIYPLFKYRYEYGKMMPHTTVLSNFFDVSKLEI